MDVWRYILFVVCLFLIWGFGYIAGRYSNAKKIASKPKIGELLVVEDEIYLSLYDENYADILKKNKSVIVDVSIVNAKKTGAITE